jgi:hypothetical protein
VTVGHTDEALGMEPNDVTIEVLRSIRDEVKGVRDEVRVVSERVDHTNTRLDEAITRIDRLERRQTEAEDRVSTLLVSVVGAVNEVRDALRDELAHRL